MQSKPLRNIHQKIPDIKHYRHLTTFLGKLGIAPQYLHRQDPSVDEILYIQKIVGTREIKIYHHYGLGLVHLKIMVEKMYEYVNIDLN